MVPEINRQTENQETAEALQFFADGMTAFRSAAAPVIGTWIALHGESWPLFTFTSGTASTDKWDGDFARGAAELSGTQTSPEGSEADHKADKRMTKYLLGGLIVKDFREGHIASGLLVGGVLLVHLVRDHKMTQVRQEGHDNGQKTNAIKINKWKTAVTLSSATLDTIPNSGKRAKQIKRVARNTGLIVGAALGVIGYHQFKNRLENERAEADIPLVAA